MHNLSGFKVTKQVVCQELNRGDLGGLISKSRCNEATPYHTLPRATRVIGSVNMNPF